MQIIFDDEKERKRFVKLAHNAYCRLQQAREHMGFGHDGMALALYYRVDTEIAARAFDMLPDDLQADIKAGDEPPGK